MIDGKHGYIKYFALFTNMPLAPPRKISKQNDVNNNFYNCNLFLQEYTTYKFGKLISLIV